MGRFDEATVVVEDGLAEAQRQGLSYDEALLLQLAVGVAKRSGRQPDPESAQRAEALFERLGIRASVVEDRATD
jgi:hypothetical protein